MRAWAVVLLLAMPLPDASACSCTTTPMSEKVEKASFVGVLRVESTRLRPGLVELLKQEEMERAAWLPILADFTPVDVLKGDVADVDAMASGFGGGDCGIALVPGYDYLVIGDPVEGELNIGLCTGSEPLGLQSLAASLPDAERWKREHPRLEAVRRQVDDGVPIPACLDNNPRDSSGHSDTCESDASEPNELGDD